MLKSCKKLPEARQPKIMKDIYNMLREKNFLETLNVEMLNFTVLI